MPRGPCRPLYENDVDIINKVDEDDVTRPVYAQEVENIVSSTRMGSRRKQSNKQTLYEHAVLPVYESKEKERRPIYENAV